MLLTEDTIFQCAIDCTIGSDLHADKFARAIEAAVLEKLKQQEPYDKTEMNAFVKSLYDQKMREGKHGHYESMFHVVHKAIQKAAPVQQERIYTDNKQTLVNALSRIEDLEQRLSAADSIDTSLSKRIAELEAQNKALAGAAKLTIAWYEAEDDHSKADFYQRLEMCRASESALRAAIAAAEGKQ